MKRGKKLTHYRENGLTGKEYKVVITQSGKADVKEKKKYILLHFKYREYAENFSRKIKKAAKQLKRFPTGHEKTGFQYRGYDIYMVPCEDHLLFYTVDEKQAVVFVLRILQDEMNWQYLIQRWVRENNAIGKENYRNQKRGAFNAPRFLE